MATEIKSVEYGGVPFAPTTVAEAVTVLKTIKESYEPEELWEEQRESLATLLFRIQAKLNAIDISAGFPKISDLINTNLNNIERNGTVTYYFIANNRVSGMSSIPTWINTNNSSRGFYLIHIGRASSTLHIAINYNNFQIAIRSKNNGIISNWTNWKIYTELSGEAPPLSDDSIARLSNVEIQANENSQALMESQSKIIALEEENATLKEALTLMESRIRALEGM